MSTSPLARATCLTLSALLLAASTAGVHAAPAPDKQEGEMNAAMAAAKAVVKTGPAHIALGNQASLDLPEGYSYIPQPEADGLMKAMGNGADEQRVGLIFPAKGDGFVDARYIASGYIKDDDARDWKADDLLDSLKQGTEEGNKERAARGIPEMEVIGWSQKPTYDAASHRLIWAIETRDKGGKDNEHGVNYNTYVLGREGYLSLDLVSDMNALAANKPFAEALLTHTHFNSGKDYTDFKAGSDKVAEYGLAALVTGVVAKKIGMFAVMAAFAAKFAKLIAVAFFGGLAAVRKFFKRSPAR